VDNISFHSFTVHGGHNSDICPLQLKPLPATYPGLDAHSTLSEAKVKQRKISDFNDYLREKETACTIGSEKAVEIVGRQANRQPFSQIQIRPVPGQPLPGKKKPAKLDDFFKSTIMIEKPNGGRGGDDPGDSNLGKRKQSGEEDRLPGRGQACKKAKPLDNFVVRIKRNSVSSCCM
jgi:hypothetical protein